MLNAPQSVSDRLTEGVGLRQERVEEMIYGVCENMFGAVKIIPLITGSTDMLGALPSCGKQFTPLLLVVDAVIRLEG